MGDYPRLASFDLDTERFCARILKMNPNPLENEMAQYHDDEWIDVDDGMIDVESFGDMIDDFHDYDEELEDRMDDAHEEYNDPDDYYDDSMDGDFDSAMRDAGFGTDEDYGYYGEDY
jgi:hypothetical protein